MTDKFNVWDFFTRYYTFRVTRRDSFLPEDHHESPGGIYKNSVREIASLNGDRFWKEKWHNVIIILKLKVIHKGSIVLPESTMSTVMISLSFSRLHNSRFVLAFICFWQSRVRSLFLWCTPSQQIIQQNTSTFRLRFPGVYWNVLFDCYKNY